MLRPVGVGRSGRIHADSDEIHRAGTLARGVDGRFYSRSSSYLFIGEHKYWVMSPCAEMDPDFDDYIVARARLYRDRRDFVVG